MNKYLERIFAVAIMVVIACGFLFVLSGFLYFAWKVLVVLAAIIFAVWLGSAGFTWAVRVFEDWTKP